MKSGDLISWEYTHHFNSKSRSQRMKHGEYIGLIRHTCRYDGPQLAMVKFQGNKRVSRVPVFELMEMSQRRQNLTKPNKSTKGYNRYFLIIQTVSFLLL